MEQELEQFTAIYNQVTAFMVNYSFQIIGAVIVLLIGIVVGRKIGNMVLHLCLKRNIDVTLSNANSLRLRTLLVLTGSTGRCSPIRHRLISHHTPPANALINVLKYWSP